MNSPGGRRHALGFTLIELSFFLVVIALLSAVALPAYRQYVERAHWADVLLSYDAIRVKAQIAAQENNRDLCRWTIQWSGRRYDAPTAALENIVNEGLKSLQSNRWKPALTHFTSALGAQAAAPLTIQFGDMGVAGVARMKGLAAEFKRMGMFNRWEREGALIASFTVYLGNCTPGHAQPVVVAMVGPTASPQEHHVACPKGEHWQVDLKHCVPVTCGPGLTLDAGTGQCQPGCKPGEFAPVFRLRGGVAQPFEQPSVGPHTCFNSVTQACPSDRPVPGDQNGALICEPKLAGNLAVGNAPKPASCAVQSDRLSAWADARMAQKLAYLAYQCGDVEPALCEFMASNAGALTCAPGQFPYARLVNQANGNRTVERGCMAADQCKSDWWEGSSQVERCQQFEAGRTYTQAFECTFCCAGDNCNGFDLDAQGNKDSGSTACVVNPALLLHWD